MRVFIASKEKSRGGETLLDSKYDMADMKAKGYVKKHLTGLPFKKKLVK